jgi:predicted neuraminidase
MKLENGDLLCFWFSGSKEGASDVGILLSRLPRGSLQWTKPVEIDHQAGKSFQNPVPFRAPQGTLWLLHTSQDAGQGQSNAEVLKLTSDDEGASWHGPESLFHAPGSFTRQPPLLTDRGEWLLPMYYTPSRGIVAGAETNYSVIKISSDQGKTWKDCEIPDSQGLVQPSVVKGSSGGYIAFFRSRFADWIYQSTSHDGCTWAPPVASRLPNNNSSIQAVRLRDGHLLVAFNNVNVSEKREKPQAGPRTPLSVALSEDDGKSWPWVRDLETGRPRSDPTGELAGAKQREEYSYPSVLETADGRIAVAYSYRRETIKVAFFKENWVRQGTTVGQFKGGRD